MYVEGVESQGIGEELALRRVSERDVIQVLDLDLIQEKESILYFYLDTNLQEIEEDQEAPVVVLVLVLVLALQAQVLIAVQDQEIVHNESIFNIKQKKINQMQTKCCDKI